MIDVLALSLALSASDPDLAGAPFNVPPPPAGTIVIETPCPQSHRPAPRCQVTPAPVRQTYTETRTHSYRSHSETRSERRVVTLNDSFFTGGLVGGVEARHAPYVVGHGHRVVVVTGSHAPRSAGQAAAARGLGTASH